MPPCATFQGGKMKEVQLTRGFITLLDDDDYEVVKQHSWQAVVFKRKVYAYNKKLGMMHRYLLGLTSGRHPQVDHEDHNGLNNQKCNLRICTVAQNAHNQRKRLGEYSSKYKGVNYLKNRHTWEARIRIPGKRVQLGTFATEQRAAEAYAKAAHELHGEFAHV